MPKTIKMNLSAGSIQNAVKELQKYKADLMRKQQVFIDRLAKIGLNVAQQTMESIPPDEKGSYYTEIMNNSRGDIVGAAIRLSGDKILFLEFSTGITYGTDAYPTPAGDKYGMGTYPSKKAKSDWDNPNGWWYVDDNGQKHHSYGNRAYMPMYHAEEAIILAVRQIAKEVFGGG